MNTNGWESDVSVWLLLEAWICFVLHLDFWKHNQIHLDMSYNLYCGIQCEDSPHYSMIIPFILSSLTLNSGNLKKTLDFSLFPQDQPNTRPTQTLKKNLPTNSFLNLSFSFMILTNTACVCVYVLCVEK